MEYRTPTAYENKQAVESRDILDETKQSDVYKKQAYDLICLSGTHGMTADELEVRLKCRQSTVACTINGLKKRELIVATGETRPARSGREVTVYTRKFSGIVKKESGDLFNVKPTFKKGEHA